MSVFMKMDGIDAAVEPSRADAGGQFHACENAPRGDIGHADLLFGADSPSSSEDRGIAWVSGDGGTCGGSSILEFSAENLPNGSSQSGPGDEGPQESITFAYGKLGSVDAAGDYDPLLGEQHFLLEVAGVTPNGPDANRHEFTIKKLVDATSPTFAPDVDDEVLVFSHEGSTNDSIWIDIGAPILRTSDGRSEYVLTSIEHTATDARLPGSPFFQSTMDASRFMNPASFQIISEGTDEAGSRLFVGNLTMHSDASNAPEGEVLVSGEEDAVEVPAVQTGGWIADVTYERMESVHALYDLVV